MINLRLKRKNLKRIITTNLIQVKLKNNQLVNLMKIKRMHVLVEGIKSNYNRSMGNSVLKMGVMKTIVHNLKKTKHLR